MSRSYNQVFQVFSINIKHLFAEQRVDHRNHEMSNDHKAELIHARLSLSALKTHTHASEGTMQCCLQTLFLLIDFPLAVLLNIC